MGGRTRTSWKGSEAVTRDVTCGGPCPSCWVTCGIELCSACLLYRGWPLMAALGMNANRLCLKVAGRFFMEALCIWDPRALRLSFRYERSTGNHVNRPCSLTDIKRGGACQCLSQSGELRVAELCLLRRRNEIDI